jgi:hypothetical protein
MEFRKADNSVYQVFLEIIEEYFPALSSFSFGLLFRQKIKKSKGGVILAEVCLPSKLLSYYAKNDQGNPYDFLIIFDEMAWSCGKVLDRVRIMRHELRHVFINEKGKCMMIGHDFQDFHAEVALNIDDPGWGSNLAEVVVAAYGQIKDGGKDPRVDRVDAPDATETHVDAQRQTHLDLGKKGGGKPDLENDYFTEEEQGKVDGTNGVVHTDKAVSPPDSPVEDATAKLNALSKKRGLRQPASASQI